MYSIYIVACGYCIYAVLNFHNLIDLDILYI